MDILISGSQNGILRSASQTPPDAFCADHPANRTVLWSMLQAVLCHSPCEYDWAADGREAVVAASRRRYTLIFMVQVRLVHYLQYNDVLLNGRWMVSYGYIKIINI